MAKATKAQIEVVIREKGSWGDWQELADRLNERELYTVRDGRVWSMENLQSYCSRTFSELKKELAEKSSGAKPVLQSGTFAHEAESVTQETVDTQEEDEGIEDSAQGAEEAKEADLTEEVLQAHTSAHGDGETQETPVTRIDETTQDELLEMLSWWKRRRDELDSMTTTQSVIKRPNFRGPKGTTKTVRLFHDLATAAEKLAQKRRAETGGTFSGLCELLLWEALGKPVRFIVPDEEDRQGSLERDERQKD